MWNGECDYCGTKMEEINKRGDFWCPWCGALYANEDAIKSPEILCKMISMLEGRKV